MRRTKIVGIATALLAALVTASAQAAPTTAKENLAAARTRARAWQADAVLIGVDTNMANAKGRATWPAAAPGLGWTYVFRSDKAGKNYFVAFGDSGVSVGEIDRTSIQPIIGDFVDSEQAIAAAAKDGFAPEQRNRMSLAQGNCLPASKEPLCWKLSADRRTYFLVSAKRGAFVGKSGF